MGIEFLDNPEVDNGPNRLQIKRERIDPVPESDMPPIQIKDGGLCTPEIIIAMSWLNKNPITGCNMVGFTNYGRILEWSGEWRVSHYNGPLPERED